MPPTISRRSTFEWYAPLHSGYLIAIWNGEYVQFHHRETASVVSPLCDLSNHAFTRADMMVFHHLCTQVYNDLAPGGPAPCDNKPPITTAAIKRD